jgi:uncharacterized membrane protein
MAADPVFAVTPRVASVNIATANTNRDGTGTVATLITGAATGTRIAEIVVQAKATTTAGMVRIFLYDGSNYFSFDEVAIAAATVSASVKGTRVSTTYSNLVLPNASWSVRVSTHNAESIDVTALGADL